ncbi:hypothetical protein [Nocardiopsis oceani]
MTFARMTFTGTAAALLIAATAACSADEAGGVPTTGGSGQDSESINTEAQMEEYDDCMREHGVEMPADGTPPEDLDVDGETVISAMEACEDILEGVDLEFDEETVEELRVWAECMRDEGIDMPDPGPDGELDLEGIDVTGDEYAEADAAC